MATHLLYHQVIMETTDLASVLGIVSGVSASLGLICVAIALTARFRHAHHRPQRQRNNNQQDATAPSDAPGTDNTEIKTAQVDLIKNNSGNYYLLFLCNRNRSLMRISLNVSIFLQVNPTVAVKRLLVNKEELMHHRRLVGSFLNSNYNAVDVDNTIDI